MIVMVLGLMVMDVSSHEREDMRKVRITQHVYNQHAQPFEKYVFKNQSELWWGKKTGTVEFGARFLGYDDFVIDTCIPASYPLFDRPAHEIKSIVAYIGSDQYAIDRVDLLLDKCSKNPADMNFIARTTYDEGKRLEQEKIESGRTVSAEERDTFVVVGLFVRYWIEKKLPL